MTITLKFTSQITEVKLWNRVNCCQERSNGLIISVGDIICGTTLGEKDEYNIPCDLHPEGNQVLIQGLDDAEINLSEIEIWGFVTSNKTCNVKLY